MLLRLYVILAVLLLISCGQMVKQFANSDSQLLLDSPDKPLVIIFSHNVNGETHPCGCRHFPLGGIPQVAGVLELERKKSAVIYLDTGDTFFLASKIPTSLKKSSLFVADYLASLLGRLELRYYTPGDQDFAAGISFLQKVSQEHNFTFLLSNLASGVKIKHRKWDRIVRKGHRIYLLGLVDPKVMLPAHRSYFSDPAEAFEQR